GSESFTITHFGEDGTETIETETEYANGEQTITFGMDSFSDIQVTAGQGGGGQGGGGQTSTSTIYVWYDTVTVSTNNSLTAKNSTTGISSVTLDNSTVPQGNGGSSSYQNSTSGLKIENAYSTSGQTVSITVTPETGYYITFISVNCCGSGAATGCTTYAEGGAYTSSFTISSAGAITRSVTLDATNGFHHTSNASNYFILIGVAPIPSPLYVEYDYGDIVTYIGDGTSAAFSTASGWTTTSSTGNEYGSGGVQTNATQYQYAYTSTGTDAGDAAEAAKWKHYANTITDEAKKEAAAAGYVFAGWKAEYYTEVEVSTKTSTGTYQYDYNNYEYDFDDDSSYGTANYDEDEAVTLTTNVRLIAQWIPIGITLTKTVEGLPDGYESSYDFTVYYSADGGETWSETAYYTTSLTVTGSSSESTYIYPAVSGLYKVVETSGNSDREISGETYYFVSVSYGDNVTVGTPSSTDWTSTDITVDGKSVTVALLKNTTLTVTNTFSKEAPTTSLIIKKVSSTSDKVVLSGAVFKLTDSNETTIDDSLTTNEYGTVAISGISYGETYTLTETTAPSGYNLLTDPIKFTVSTSGVVKLADDTDSSIVSVSLDDGVYTITVENEPGTVLPSTGGTGTWMYTLTGLTLCGAALVLWKRRETD
ncbi:MAG: LPXTG cell wall anchor domain-containing protein, partial [Clostridiales bacterium]|nr:LPXTG cell wall anchor domain-containing protein [Clostridiales bacterium]